MSDESKRNVSIALLSGLTLRLDSNIRFLCLTLAMRSHVKDQLKEKTIFESYLFFSRAKSSTPKEAVGRDKRLEQAERMFSITDDEDMGDYVHA